MGHVVLHHRLGRSTSSLLATLVLATALAGPASAQVLINEILANPVGNDVGTERIEIYNAGPSAVNLTGWAIDDAATIDEVAVRARFPEDLDPTCSTNAIIGPGEFRVVMMQGGAAVLNNGGDDIYLISDRLLNPTVVHTVTYGQTPGENTVWSAIPNGSTNFAWRDPTLCGTNGGAGDVTPPATVANLAAAPGEYPGEIRLTWTAPGDDGAAGTASAYIIKVAHVAITAGTFDAAADLDRWRIEPLPGAGGAAETLYVHGLDPDSTWYFALTTQDEVPNTAAVSNSPGSVPLGGALLDPDLGYSAYFGNLHSHTGYSDGDQTPAEAYAFARLGAPTPLDFLAVTEHNHTAAGMQYGNYALGLAAAQAANDDGDFVAIFGQEWGVTTNPGDGHVNVFESPALFGWEPGQYDVFVAQSDYLGLYDAAVANPPSSYPLLLEFCHPGADDFGNFVTSPAGLSAVRLIALVNGPAFSTSTTESDIGNTGFDGAFREALRKGFRVSPTGDQDNHNATWGAATETRTAALAAGKTKSGILGALAAGRAYATQDHNTIVHLSADGHPMGDAWTSETGIRLAIEIVDPDPGDAVAQIEIYRGITGVSDAVLIAANAGSDVLHWREHEVLTPGTEAHYYARIRMADNASIWTGPVFVTYDEIDPVSVGDPLGDPGLSLAAGPVPARERVTARFALSRAGRGELVVYDASGRRVRTLLDGPLDAGTHQVTWNGLDDRGQRTPAGMFFLRLGVDGHQVSRKVLMLP
jgi:hypothetical protein